ncbi:MAG: tRNA lysidine(34) synthetase TilS [Burkholderiales bacterium]|nr:tRNA lysidine(34) synthetase TilS [Burkholderiales bacterium]
MHPLEEHVLHKYLLYLKDNVLQPQHLIVGLSGGVDSVVLLHILAKLNQTGNTAHDLSALHINHGISSNAAFWSQFCHKYCASLNIALTVIKHHVVKSGGESLENNARKVRYQEFLNSTAPIIGLAHQKNDQLETTISQIFRGSDLHNIAAMREISYKKNKLIWRPLLDISRDQIESYAQEYNLTYIDDESNNDINYLRNFIRQIILPSLTKFDKNIHNKILKLPQQLQNTLDLVDHLAEIDLEYISTSINNEQVIIVEQLKTLDHIRQYNVLAYYLKKHNLPLPTLKQLNEFINQVLSARWEKQPSLHLNKTHTIIKSKNYIKLVF